MKVLLSEDDETISGHVKTGFEQEGHELAVAADVDEVMALITQVNFELVILDLMLPKTPGIEILSQLRTLCPSLPIIILSAIHSVDERIKCLELGADDYLTKPFSLHELLARCHAILRRLNGSQEKSELNSGEIAIDLNRHRVAIAQKELSLAEKEFRLLVLLLKNKGEVLTKSRILEEIWNYKFDPQTNIVDVLVCRLRSKLSDHNQGARIETIRGVGYVFK